MLSVTTAPSTVKRLSNDCPPEIVTTCETPFPSRSLEPGPFVFTTGREGDRGEKGARHGQVVRELLRERLRRLRCGRRDGLGFRDDRGRGLDARETEDGVEARFLADRHRLRSGPPVLNPWSANVTVYSPGGRPGKT